LDQNGVNVGICLDSNQGNFQLHRFTTSENIAKSFLTHTVHAFEAPIIVLCLFKFGTDRFTQLWEL